MECLLPSEIARLVFGYLEDEGCTEAAQKFLETSENLKECRSRTNPGVRFRTRVLGFNLIEMLQMVSSVYSLVESRTRRTPVPKEIAHGSFLEQLDYLLSTSDNSNDLSNGIPENNAGLLKALNRTMFENTTFHKKLAENINKMRTTPELAPETIAESIVKEKGFEELIEELLDAVPIPENNQAGGKSSKENRPIKSGSNNHHNTKEDGKKKTSDSNIESGKSISNCNQISIEDENAAAVQSILESCRMPIDQSDSISRSPTCKATTHRKSMDTPSIIDKAMVDCVTPLKEMAYKTYNNSLNLDVCADADQAMETESVGGESVNGDVSRLDHSHADVASPAPHMLTCTPVLLVCDTPNSLNQKVKLGVTSCNLHTKAEDRRIKSKFRRILPKPTNTNILETNGKISYPNGITLQVLSQLPENLEVSSEENKVDRIAEGPTKVDDSQVDRVDQSLSGNVDENSVVERMGLPVIQDSRVEVSDGVEEMEPVNSDRCSAESVVNSQDQSTNVDNSKVEDKITPVDRQGPRRKLSLSTPRRGRHIRSLDFTTPNKKILGQRSKTSPKQILHQPKFRHSKLRSNLFKSPPIKLKTIPDVEEKEDKLIESGIVEKNDEQAAATIVPVEKNFTKALNFEDSDKKVVNDSIGKSEKSKVKECAWDSNLRALIGETTSNVTVRKPRRRQYRRVIGSKKRAALAKSEEIDDINTSDEQIGHSSPNKDSNSVQNTSEPDATTSIEGTKDEVSNVAQTISGVELKTPPGHIFQTPLKLDQPFIPQTPVLDTPMLKSIIEDTSTIDPDLLLTPSFRVTPFKTPRSEKKVMVQTLSPSKMLINNKASEKVTIDGVKKSPTLRSSETKSNSFKNVEDNVSPKSNLSSTHQRNLSPKTGSRNNGASGKSDLIQSLLKQAEKNILGNISDIDSDEDEDETEIKTKSEKCSKKGNIKHKRSQSKERYDTGNRSLTSQDGVSVKKPEKSSPGKKKSPLKKDKIQDSVSMKEDKISPNSVVSNVQNLSKENDGSLSKSASERSSTILASSLSVNSNSQNESKEKIDSPKVVNDNNSSNSFPPKKKYVQTILLSTSTSIKSKRSLKVKNSSEVKSTETNIVESSTSNSNVVSPSRPNSKPVCDKSSEESPSKRTSSTDQQTIDFLLEKKKRLLNKLREPNVRSRKKKSCTEVIAALPVQKRIGHQTKNVGRAKPQINSIAKKSSEATSKSTNNENSLNFSSESSLSPIKTSTPFVDKITKNRSNSKKNVENKFSPSNRLGKTFSEISTTKNASITVNKNPSTVEGVCDPILAQNQQLPAPRSPTPLDKDNCGAGKRISVGNELYEHVFHDETRPIKVSSQRNIVHEKDLSISIFDTDMDGNEFETVFVAQPLNTLFEFVPPENRCPSGRPDEEHLNRREMGGEDVKKDDMAVDNGVKVVSKSPVGNGSQPPPPSIDRTTRLVQMASNRIPILNQVDKNRGEGVGRLSRNVDNSKSRHSSEKSRDRYSSSSPPRRDSYENYRNEGRRNDKRSGRNRERSRDRSRERHRSKSRHRDKSRGKHREESKRDRPDHRRQSRIDSSSRYRDRSRSSDRSRRKETKRDSRKHRDKSSHSSSGRTKHHDDVRHDERPKKTNQVPSLREEGSEDGEVQSKYDGSSDECHSSTVASSHHNQSSSKSLNEASTARMPSKSHLGKRPSSDVSRNIAEKRPKTDDAQKLLKNMDSEHLEKFLSVVHPDD